MLKTASALLAAVAMVCGVSALALGPTTRVGLVLLAGALFFGWFSFAARPLRREIEDAVAVTLREPLQR
ncbi:hypothetical protein [uncultured Alsobacter sp.]|uniref:hypothetical protein n=1 Tax=uncultured Alsobacter sp. TaxID=1748258 RepID=UPI0025E36A64|nr:hypothetical protein [uncultured Alsobacter sp.]